MPQNDKCIKNATKKPNIPLDCKYAKTNPPINELIIGKKENFLGRRKTAGI